MDTQHAQKKRHNREDPGSAHLADSLRLADTRNDHKRHKNSHKSRAKDEGNGPRASADSGTNVLANRQKIDRLARGVLQVMTKEDYDKQQREVRREFDADTQRWRLVKGTGEIMEEIVSLERHVAIKMASTAGDGATFARTLGLL